MEGWNVGTMEKWPKARRFIQPFNPTHHSSIPFFQIPIGEQNPFWTQMNTDFQDLKYEKASVFICENLRPNNFHDEGNGP